MQFATAASTIRSSRAHRVAMKTIANSEATAVRLQKICMAQRPCRQNSSNHKMNRETVSEGKITLIELMRRSVSFFSSREKLNQKNDEKGLLR